MSKLVHTYKSENYAATLQWSKIDNKKKVYPISERLYQYIINKFAIGDKLSITITSKKPKRTMRQNSYWWFYLTIASKETGHTPEELHEWAKRTCLPSKVTTVLGTPIRMKSSTQDLSVGEFCDLILNFEEKTGIPAPETKNWELAPLRDSK